MTHWLREGEKFSLIGLQVDADTGISDSAIVEGLEVYTSLKLDMPGHWRGWLGTLRIEEIEACNLILLSRHKSKTPGVLDGENQALSRKVGLWYTGLMLACPLDAWQDPITTSGEMRNGELDIREFSTLDAPHGSTIRPRTGVTVDSLHSAARMASAIDTLLATPEASLWRLMRCLDIYQKARTLSDVMDRIHQFARCIEGLLATSSGTSKARFKSRTELFVGPKHHETMGTIYDIRSEVEHLHEDLRLKPFDRDKRLEIAKMEAVAGELARQMLSRIFSDPTLAVKMGSRDDLEAFWQLDATERQAIWGPIYDLLEPLNGVREDLITNHDLGGTE
ncbi:MAG: hypothetical protein EWV70_09530 [Microcystis flos-aquae Mf_QC_C_20070823_S20]|nr:MAG: hypothetical protein EWV70_09530 [Microcystis flos-aquae Mf_QC_C_20070823_S20]